MTTDAAGDAKGARDKSKRAQQDDGVLKAIRYEDAPDGVPPVTTPKVNSPKQPASPKADAAVTGAGSERRSETKRVTIAPSRSPRTPPAPSNDVKRDSGIAPSVSTVGRLSYADSQLSWTAGGAAKEPALPTILVQDEESPLAAERSRSPFAKMRPKDKQAKDKPASPPDGVQRVSSFRGIQSDIPSGDLSDIGEIELEDLASDKVAFSNRGSLLFGGKKMNQLLQLQDDGIAQSDGTTLEGTTTAIGSSSPQTPPSNETLPNDDTTTAKQGLVAGRRKPSVHMRQAVLDGGRVLSAEEITFSVRVRSMYEYGDERAAEWTSPIQQSGEDKEISVGASRDVSTPDVSLDVLTVAKTRPAATHMEHPALRSSTPDMRASYARGSSELAGGIEDWEDINRGDVDRYGFISPRRVVSTISTSSQAPATAGVQRVATSLQLQSDQPRRARKLRRGASTATRTSRSVPPRPSTEETVRGGGSVRSLQSHRSVGQMHSGTLFRSRDRRAVDEASDMLTLPPGLADIAEQEDGGRTALMLKQREWSREQKWQKMARPVPSRSNGKGAGMEFDFDTSDPKLVERTWKGIPDRWRATAWHSFLSASARRRGKGATDAELVTEFHALQERSSADDVQIDVDVPRTISMHIMFRRRYRGGQRLLFRVLHAISIHFPEIGYVQGMASLAATLLCYFDEERAFVMLVRLWQLRGLEQLFRAGFAGLMAALRDFEAHWLGSGAADVAHKLTELGIDPTAYGTRWYLTLFNMSVPFPAQLRVWDVFLLLGDDIGAGAGSGSFGGADLDVLHATSAALVDATREIILDSDFENAMKVLTSFMPVKDEDLLMRVARAEWKMRKKRGGGGGKA